MSTYGVFVLLLLVQTLTIWGVCPGPNCQRPIDGSYYEIRSERTDWPTAKSICENEGGHLWRVDSELEFNKIMVQVLGCERKDMKSSYPSLWTDGVIQNGDLVWSTNGQPVDFNPAMGTYTNICCSGMACGGGSWFKGNCLALGWISNSYTDFGWGGLSCDCSGGSTVLSFVCEYDA